MFSFQVRGVDYTTEETATPIHHGETEHPEDLCEALETAVSSLVTTTTSTPPSTVADTLEQSQSELSAQQLENHLLSKSESADSAVEATEEILEDLESKVCSDDEKENVNVEENNIISNCDINGDTEKKTDNAVYKGEDSSDRINLAEIKI